MKGHLFVISAPSGTGKTTIVKRLLEVVPNLTLSVSYTTRSPRPQEKDGVDYFFIDEDKFHSMVKAHKFVEWAEVHGNLYGSPKEEVEKKLLSGLDVLLDVDTKGARSVKQRFPEAILIFLLPPSFEELERRLRTRGMNTGKDLETRIKNAREEYSRRHEYDYQVVNEDLDEAFDEIQELINYHRG